MLGKYQVSSNISSNKREKLNYNGGGTVSPERDEGAEAVVSIIPDQMTSLDNAFDDDNYEA
ncbi:Hypothetical predicted protein, partial [Paramuricea clavata]